MLSGFVDESKSKTYIFSLVIVKQNQLQSTRRLLRDLVLPGQRSLHFSKESMSRRGEILKSILAANLELLILETGLKGHKEGRLAGLIGLSEIAQNANLHSLLLERDDSTFNSDQRILRGQFNQVGRSDQKNFDFRYRHEEPILWAADAIAWSYQKGGMFRHRLLEAGVKVLSP